MKNFYEVGRVYVWQNLVLHAHLNGTETTVTEDVKLHAVGVGIRKPAQLTDTLGPDGVRFFAAGPGSLRPKNPPPGEQSVLDMFKLNDLVDA